MKKLALLILMTIFALSLAACDNLPEEVNICLENPDAEGCPVICPTGQELDIDTATCVPIDDTEELVCPVGQSEVEGVCVLVEIRTPQQILLDFIVDGFEDDGNMAFLGTAMANMDFTSGMTITTDIQFEVTEDIDETHYIEGQIIDVLVEDETNGNMMQRQIIVDVDGEFDLDFTVIYHEVEGGVHVYIQPGMILDAITEENPDALEVLEWVGFDQPWAVFEFDDSLEAVIQVEVLKEMFVDLFFSEMGELYFTEVQNDMEEDLGFDLNQYGLNLGLLMDTLIEEDFTTAETMIDAIDFDAIALHMDAKYVAPELYEFLYANGTELALAGMDITKLSVLDTATWVEEVEDDMSTPMVDEYMDAYWMENSPVDPLKGTKVFFDSLVDADIQAIVDAIIEPVVTEMVYDDLMDQLDTYWLENEFKQVFYTHEGEIYASTSSEFYTDGTYASFEAIIAEIESVGVLAYYNDMTPEEDSYLRYLIEYDTPFSDSNKEWQWDALNDVERRIELEVDVAQWVTDHADELVLMGYLQTDIDQWLIDIPVVGLEAWYESLPEDVLDLALEQEVFARVDAFVVAVDAEEGAEWLVTEFFGNPHVTQALLEIGMNPVFDHEILAMNFMSVDFDALVLEMLDLEELATAVYDGPVLFDAYLVTLAVASPNYAAILEVLTPGVESVQPYMMYVDDAMYAFDGLVVFEDFIDLTYYMEDIFDIEVSATEDLEILTEFEVDGLAFAILFNDLSTNLGVYLAGYETIEDYPFDDEWVCLDPLDEECEEPDFTSVLAELSTLGSINAYMLMDPINPTSFELGVDFTDVLNGLVEDEYAMISAEEGYTPDSENNDVTGVNELSITINVSDVAEITLPLETETSDVNMIVQDVAKYAMTMEAYEYLEDIAYMYSMEDQTYVATLFNTNVALEDVPNMNFSQAFDLEMSYVSLNVDLVMGVPNPLTLDLEIVLYWLDGTLVFDSAVSMAEVAALMVDGDLVSEAAYQLMVDKVDDANWHTTKLFMVYLLEDNNDSMNDYE